MKRFFEIRLLIILLVFFSGCKGENAELEMGYEYYPAEIGSWISYEVDSVMHFVEDFADTVRYEIKEVVTESFIDDAGRPARRLERFYRNNDSEDWRIKDVWQVVITSVKVEKVEENERFVRLVFPVSEGKLWDGNALNTRAIWDYEIAAVGQPVMSGEFLFEEAATVNQEGALNLIEQEFGVEYYAKNIGLVFRHETMIKTDVNYLTNPTPANIQSGYELWYRYTGHGQD